jgi:D-glycero-D-manno-heptose 1,7-bisphosphate phosphatase
MNDKAAVFLDLQGTLGGDGLDDIRHFSFYKSAILAIKLINDIELLTIIITNQSHIARGYFTYQYFLERMESLKQEAEENGAKLDAVYCCPHHVNDNCECMKPKPGLVFQARNDLSLDLTQCYFVGDTGVWDMALAHAIGCKKVLVKTGLGESSLGEFRYTWSDITPDFVATDILDAAKWIKTDIAFKHNKKD